MKCVEVLLETSEVIVTTEKGVALDEAVARRLCGMKAHAAQPGTDIRALLEFVYHY